MEDKIQIGENYPLTTGDVVEIHARATGLVWVQAWQWAQIEKAVNKDPHFQVVSVRSDDKTLVMRVRVISNPIAVSTLIGIIVVAVPLLFLSIAAIFLVKSETAPTIAKSAMTFSVAAVLGGIYLLTKRG